MKNVGEAEHLPDWVRGTHAKGKCRVKCTVERLRAKRSSKPLFSSSHNKEGWRWGTPSARRITRGGFWRILIQ